MNSAAQTRLRGFAPVAAVLMAFVIVGGLGGWLLVQSRSTGSAPPTGGVWWRLTGGPESVSADDEATAPRLDQATIRNATEIPVVVYWPGNYSGTDASWLGPPTITYTRSAVTITMRLSDTFSCGPRVPPSIKPSRQTCGWTLSPRYVPVPVHLREPLRGRGLFDGSTSPPQQRWFSWSPASSIDLVALKASYAAACKDATVLDAVLCEQVKIAEMTADGRSLNVPTTLSPADDRRAYAICDRLALAHVDPVIRGYELHLRVLDVNGRGLGSCPIRAKPPY